MQASATEGPRPRPALRRPKIANVEAAEAAKAAGEQKKNRRRAEGDQKNTRRKFIIKTDGKE